MLRWLARQYAKRIVNINANICVASSLALLLTTGLVSVSRNFGVEDTDKRTIMIITYAGDWVIDLVVALALHWLANHWPKDWSRSRSLIEKADEVLDSAPAPVLSVMKDAAAGALIPHVRALGRKGEENASRTGGMNAETSRAATSAASVDQSPASIDLIPPPAPPPSNHAAGTREVSFVRDATAIQLQRLCLSPVFYAVAAGLQLMMLHEHFSREWSVVVPFFTAIIVTRAIHTYWMIKTDPVVFEEWEQARRRRHARGLRRFRELNAIDAGLTPGGLHVTAPPPPPRAEPITPPAPGGA
ncbi:hypothetical protein BH11PLA1_BH11PLA1_01080 [soil metagenome]